MSSAVRLARKGINGAFDLGGIAHSSGINVHPQGSRRSLHHWQISGRCWIGGIVYHGHTSDVRRDLLEQFQPFRADGELKVSEPGDVSARPRETSDQSRANRIGDLGEDDGYAAGFPLHRRRNRGRSGKNDVRF